MIFTTIGFHPKFGKFSFVLKKKTNIQISVIKMANNLCFFSRKVGIEWNDIWYIQQKEMRFCILDGKFLSLASLAKRQVILHFWWIILSCQQVMMRETNQSSYFVSMNLDNFWYGHKFAPFWGLYKPFWKTHKSIIFNSINFKQIPIFRIFFKQNGYQQKFFSNVVLQQLISLADHFFHSSTRCCAG